MEANKNPLVSVITIFFNAEQFIDESIESVINQTYNNWELLLIDDGSFDRSSEIAKKYKKKFPDKIFYYEHPDHQNKGTGPSRNLGIKLSNGRFIAFLDADDVWLPHKLDEQIKILLENPEAKMMYGNTLYWWSWQNQNKKKDLIFRIGKKSNTIVEPYYLIPLFLNSEAPIPCTCSTILVRDLFNTISFEDEFTGLYEDQAFYYRVCLETKVYVSDKIWDKYRQHKNSICYTAKKNGELYTSRINFLIWLWKYIIINKLEKPEIKTAICNEFWKCKLLEKAAHKYVGILRWTIKWLFKLEKLFISEKIRYFRWQSSKTYNLLMQLSSVK